jgi:hypothetical protein
VPSKPSQSRDLRAVTLSIPVDLRDPVVGIEAPLELLLETSPVPAVPEVAIAEDDRMNRWEYQIRPAWQSGGVGPVAEAPRA